VSTGPSEVVSGMVAAVVVFIWFLLIVGPPIAMVYVVGHFVAKFW
jgi:hypothetical protein